MKTPAAGPGRRQSRRDLDDGLPVVDAVTGTDGLDVASASFGANYPRGLLVAQDDANTAPVANQNFKLVDWREVEAALGLDRLEPEQ